MATLFAQEQGRSAQRAACCQGELRSKRKHGGQSIFFRATDSLLIGRGERLIWAASPCAPPYVHAQSRAVLRDRLADRPHAISILVEHLVGPPTVGQAAQRVSQRPETSAADSARARAIGRTHNCARRERSALVSR